MDMNKDIEGLLARLGDLRERAIRGQVGISAFLSPRELYYAQAFLQREKCAFIAFGGYKSAERKRIYILPEYMESVVDAGDLSAFGFDTETVALKVKGSGFFELSHRAFMGSLLGLGLERSVVGDIVITEENTAIIICDKAIKDFLIVSWDKVGKDRVKVAQIELNEDFEPHRSYTQINDTVASARLDCVIAALCSLSRENARQTVLAGLVEMDYEIQEHPDKEVKPICLISVKGYGKFRVISLSDKTKKGRYRLQAEKFL